MIVLLFRQEIKGTGVKLINILPGFVDTEGIREVFSNEYSAGVMKEYGYGDIESIRSACWQAFLDNLKIVSKFKV